MALRNIPLIRELVRSLRISSGDELAFSAELKRELEDSRKISLNLLIALLAIHAISVSHALGATTLALLVYTLNLHIVINTRFLQGSPTLSIVLHAIPLLGIFCMAVFKLVIIVQSPVVATAVLLACALPSLIIAVQFANWYTKMILMPFPVQMQDVVSVVPGPIDTTAVSG